MNAHTLRAELHGDDAVHPAEPPAHVDTVARHRRIHTLAREGHSTRAIASRLEISRDTVRKYLHNGVRDTSEYAAMRYDHAREEWVVDDGGER